MSEIKRTEPRPTRIIEASGQTDDIRYILHQRLPCEQDAEDAVDPTPAIAPDSGNEATSAGLADTVVDNADDALPDRTQSTIAGGQVARESKRGAY